MALVLYTALWYDDLMELNFNKENLSYICVENNISYLGLFGSQSRQDARLDSDVDLLVDFDQTKSFFELSRLKTQFEKLFHKKIDITMRKNIKKTISPLIFNDLNTLYDKSS